MGKKHGVTKRQKTEEDEKKMGRATGCISIQSEQAYRDVVETHEKVVCHFYEDRNQDSEIVDCLLEGLVKDHQDTTYFMKICAAKLSTLVTELNIKKIPTIALIKSGQPIHLVVVPDILDVEEEFGTDDLEKIFYDKGIVDKTDPAEERVELDWPDSDDCMVA